MAAFASIACICFNEVRAIQPGSTVEGGGRRRDHGLGASMRSGLFSPEVLPGSEIPAASLLSFNEVRAIQPGSTMQAGQGATARFELQ